MGGTLCSPLFHQLKFHPICRKANFKRDFLEKLMDDSEWSYNPTLNTFLAWNPEKLFFCLSYERDSHPRPAGAPFSYPPLHLDSSVLSLNGETLLYFFQNLIIFFFMSKNCKYTNQNSWIVSSIAKNQWIYWKLSFSSRRNICWQF